MNKGPILIAALILGSFAVGGVGLVAMTHEVTAERIAENQREGMLAKLRAIVPAERMANDPLEDRIEVSDPDLLGTEQTEVFRVRGEAGPVAVVLQPVVPDGYAGPIRLLVSVLADGSLGGVRVLEHHETPGLGDKIDEKKDDWIIEQFSGKSLRDPAPEEWQVKRDGGVFDQFTGATITPRSIVKAVKNTLVFVAREGEALYLPPDLERERAAPGAEPLPAPATAKGAAPSQASLPPLTSAEAG